MRALKLAAHLIVSAMVMGCATTPQRPPEEAFSLVVADNVPEERFDIRLVSLDQRKICLTVEQWPSPVGQLHMGSDLASVATDGEVLYAIDENFGYCPGGCGELVVQPNGELKGFIAYSTFEGGSRLRQAEARSLNFSVQPYYCRD